MKIVHNADLNYATRVCMTGSDDEKCSNDFTELNAITSGKATLSFLFFFFGELCIFKERKRRHICGIYGYSFILKKCETLILPLS